MKQLAAIVFSLLLIVAQSFAIAAPVSGGSCSPKASCCCCCAKNCDCHIDEGSSAVPPVASAVPASDSLQLISLPAGCVLYQIALPATSSLAPNADMLQSAPSQPLFRLNCALLI